MPPQLPVGQRQTTKQAKAAFKARGRPSLSPKEQRQLDRAIELDRRASGTREQEKKRAEALKKRQEKEKSEREEREKTQLDSQRRCDKYGHRSSQFHLGAFFGTNTANKKTGDGEGSVGLTWKAEEEGELFDDDGVDDELLLQALEPPKTERSGTITAPDCLHSDNVPQIVSEQSIFNSKRTTAMPAPAIEDDWSKFWDELVSSTQIARELESENPADNQGIVKRQSPLLDPGDFDMTVEELDELRLPCLPAWSKAEGDHNKLMPPPALPLKPRVGTTRPPRQPTKSSEPIAYPRLPVTSIRPPALSDFTVSELESFVEDDLQLTQAAPG